ncbi:MAG: cytochrome c3 family protein [Candidatus Zhuqueibacterota bacterium]
MTGKLVSVYLTFIISMVLLFPGIGASQDISSEDCMECHSDKALTRLNEDGKEDSLFVHFEKFSNSVHAGLSCVDCHSAITELPHDEKLEKPNCGNCHDDVTQEYMASVHGKSLAKGNLEAPECWSCHTSHYVFPIDDSLSTMFVLNQPEICGECHSDPNIVKKFNIPISEPAAAYKTSIHYRSALEEGNMQAAKCSDCHGAHNLQPSSNPVSLTNKFNIPRTCAQCHQGIFDEYMAGVHGKGLLAGATDSPVCTDCHTEHDIKSHTDPKSTVFSTVISKTTCPRCHEAEQIVTKYGLKKEAVDSYNDSYHGLANRAGSVVTANCASCHGVHKILHSSDPKSSVNKANLQQTCGSCHPGVSDMVAIGSIHIKGSSTSQKTIYYVTTFYIFLIVGTIGGMFMHNLIDFIHKFKAKIKGVEDHSFEELSHGITMVRLSLNERIQHFILMGTFITLVITGFALKFPEAWWAAPFTRWDGGFAMRGYLHRLAGGLMVLLAFYHVFYVITTKRGKRHITEMLPKLKDLFDVIQNVQYNLGLRKDRPKFAYYNYIEKAEYWALIWGTIVMSVTGFILWFENISLKYFPKLVSDVSTVAHYYEAILATVAIIVWHFYYQFFDPHVYPMNTTCFTGKMSEETIKLEHGMEYEKLTKKE